MRGRRMVRQHLQRLEPFVDVRFEEFLAHYRFGSRIVTPRVKLELPAVIWLRDRPSGQHSSEFGDVRLRVSAVYAECVQLHDLAAIILVQAALAILARRLRMRPNS